MERQDSSEFYGFTQVLRAQKDLPCCFVLHGREGNQYKFALFRLLIQTSNLFTTSIHNILHV